jgi:hypothetical protein
LAVGVGDAAVTSVVAVGLAAGDPTGAAHAPKISTPARRIDIFLMP